MARSQSCKDLGRRAAHTKALRQDGIGGNAAGRGKPRAIREHNLVGDEVMRWWELLTGGFVVTKRSLGGLKYDEGHLAFHLASKLCWLVVSLSIRASWGHGGGWTSLKKFGRGDLPLPSWRMEGAEHLQWPEPCA